MEVMRLDLRAMQLFRCCYLAVMLLAATGYSYAQKPAENYTIKNGRMLIELSKQLSEDALDSFIVRFDLFDLNLKEVIKNSRYDTLQKLGWKLEKNNRELLVISKLLSGFDSFDNPAYKIIFAETNNIAGRFPSVSGNLKFGYNRFTKKYPFQVKDSVVIFYLRNNQSARRVMLAGSFNNWNPEALAMTPTDSGWIAFVTLSPGKYWYKFIVDGNWTVDKDNGLAENDGMGNNNSVYYKPNYTFKLNGFEQAKWVFLSGSFNGWEPRQLALNKTTGGWTLPLYLAKGTHTYRFIANGKWMADPFNADRLPNEFNEFNSVIRIGTPYVFRLPGYQDAKEVVLAGSFNNWREDELFLEKTDTGWVLPYTLGPGNYEYRFKVNGKSINYPANETTGYGQSKQRNARLVIGANYTFRLKGHAGAANVFLAGDFNNWSPNSFAMQKVDNEWTLRVNLSPGKHTYKFVVDGEWIRDPGNELWEQNEYSSGNSVIWFTPGDEII